MSAKPLHPKKVKGGVNNRPATKPPAPPKAWGSNWWNGVPPGAMVHYTNRQGQKRKGRVVMSLPTHLVLNGGGPHGTPVLVDGSNYNSHTNPR